ncbi:MAG: menaquinol-cytochrome C reductase [Dehalococcoidia bacterium]|nr:menaquinol-cytochrome C reductase [Dehalococcoidia bacterium]
MNQETPEIFPKSPKKTYGLMELVKGTSPAVDKGPEDTVMSWPNLLILEVLTALGTTVLLLFWSLAMNAPLRELANPDVTENPAKAPWYFMNLQELLLHMHPALAGVIIPAVVILVLMAIPYFDRSKADIGIWFASRKGRMIAIWSTVYTMVTIVGLILFDEFVRVRSLISTPEILPGTIIPLAVIGGLMVLLYFMIRRWQPTRREVLIGLFTAFAVTYLLLTISGTMFRGLGMHLTWPWDLPPGALTF